jgi:hypothetical protein
MSHEEGPPVGLALLLVVEQGVDLGSEGDVDALVSLPLCDQQRQVSDVLLGKPVDGLGCAEIAVPGIEDLPALLRARDARTSEEAKWADCRSLRSASPVPPGS